MRIFFFFYVLTFGCTHIILAERCISAKAENFIISIRRSFSAKQKQFYLWCEVPGIHMQNKVVDKLCDALTLAEYILPFDCSCTLQLGLRGLRQKRTSRHEKYWEGFNDEFSTWYACTSMVDERIVYRIMFRCLYVCFAHTYWPLASLEQKLP